MANKHGTNTGVTITWTAQLLTNAFASPPVYAPYDPVTPTLIIQDPTLAETTYHYPADAIIKKVDVGKYQATFVPTAIGTWRWKWLDPDATKPGYVEGSITAVAPKIT